MQGRRGFSRVRVVFRLVCAVAVAVLFFATTTSAVGGVPYLATSGGSSALAKYDRHLTEALEANPPSVRIIAMTEGSPQNPAQRAGLLGASIRWTFTIIDGFAAEVPVNRLDDVANSPGVRRVFLDRPTTTLMDVSHKAVQADHAWNSGHRGKGVTVAVLDTGISANHPSFANAIVACVATIGALVDGPDEDSDMDSVSGRECTDTDGHGTHVAGTVAGRDRTYPGVAPEAKLAVVRVLQAAGAGLSSDSIAGMQWVRDNRNTVSPPIKVATMSIGPLEPECGDDNNPDAQAANNLVASGIFFSVAAGNSGHDDGACTIDGAAAGSKVTSVAAVDDKATVSQSDDVIASFSSGGSSNNGKPDIAYPGVRIRSAGLGGFMLPEARGANNKSTIQMDGTSMATPHAAGTAALLAAKEAGLSAQQIKDRITSTAVKTTNTGNSFNSVYGHGLGNVCRALQLSGCTGSVATPAPVAQLSPSSLSFGSQVLGAAGAPRAVTVSNTGKYPMTIWWLTTSDERGITVNDYAQTNNCPASLDAGAACTVQISFRPLQTGERPAWLQVWQNSNEDFGFVSVPLSGFGVVPPVSTSPPTSFLSIDDAMASEGTDPAKTTQFIFNVTLAPARSEAVEVAYFVSDGTAGKADGDYTNSTTPTPLIFAPGETRKQIAVPVTADGVPERDEFFQVFLTNNTNSVVAKGRAAGLIRDDDGGNAPPVLSISDAQGNEGNGEGSTFFSFKVSLSAPSGAQTVSVKYATFNGTAESAGGDYRHTENTLTFLPGETEKTIIVSVGADGAWEYPEFFQVYLMHAQNAATGKSQAVGVILNDD